MAEFTVQSHSEDPTYIRAVQQEVPPYQQEPKLSLAVTHSSNTWSAATSSELRVSVSPAATAGGENAGRQH